MPPSALRSDGGRAIVSPCSCDRNCGGNGSLADSQCGVASKPRHEEGEAMSTHGFRRALAATLVFALATLTALPAAAQVRATLKGHTLALASVDYSPDVHYLATGSYDRTAKIWDAATGTEVATLRGHQGTVEAVRFAPDGKTVASGSHDNTIKLWDVATRKERATLRHDGAVRSLAFSHDSKILASGSNDFTATLWDVATGHELATLRGHEH